jgi:3-oxoadipate enol-lactonase
MPTLENGGGRLHYEVNGNGDGPVLVLANSLGSNLHIWGKVLSSFEKSFMVIRYDMRGHGASGVPVGSYTIEQLGGDLLSMLDHLAIDRAHLCGISLGGLIAMWAAIHAPQRLGKLVLANTAARIGTSEGWEQRIATVESAGMEALAQQTPERWFTTGYLQQHPEEMEAVRRMVSATSAQGYCGCCAVLRDTDLRKKVAAIAVPCLVVAGTYDLATPPADGLALNASIHNSSYVELDASHLSAWEKADEFSAAVTAFLLREETNHG